VSIAQWLWHWKGSLQYAIHFSPEGKFFFVKQDNISIKFPTRNWNNSEDAWPLANLTYCITLRSENIKKTIEYMLLEWFFFSNHAGRHKTHYFYNKPAKQPALAEANFLFG